MCCSDCLCRGIHSSWSVSYTHLDVYKRQDQYAGWLKEAYDALDADKQAYFAPVIEEVSTDAEDLGLGENGKYALAWIKLWVENYNAQTDDGPICNTLVTSSATDQSGLLAVSYTHLIKGRKNCSAR